MNIRIVMLTGDNQRNVWKLAAKTRHYKAEAEILPEDKSRIKSYKAKAA